MSSTLVVAAADDISLDAATFASLPPPLALRVFLALPADARGRACCVCRAWRDALDDPSLWSRLDMSFLDTDDESFWAVWLGAAGRARGQLHHLDVSQHSVQLAALHPVLTANAGSLRELHLRHLYGEVDWYAIGATVEVVVAAAPLLQVLTAEYVTCSWENASRMLRVEPPFAPLQMRRSLEVSFSADRLVGGMERFGPFAAALADAALQPALGRLCVRLVDTAQPALMGALVDAALARRLLELRLDRCTPPDAAPLARLLAEGSLAALEIGSWTIWGVDAGTPALFDAAGAALVADALRVNTTLTKLDLYRARFCVDMRVAEAILGALVGHHSLRTLEVACATDLVPHCSALGNALAELIAADAPALHVLACQGNSLADAGLAPIVDALTLNRHLRELHVLGNDMSEQFARERLLPAVRAKTTLRKLGCANTNVLSPAEAEAVPPLYPS
jgi:hypothetical protein